MGVDSIVPVAVVERTRLYMCVSTDQHQYSMSSTLIESIVVHNTTSSYHRNVLDYLLYIASVSCSIDLRSLLVITSSALTPTDIEHIRNEATLA